MTKICPNCGLENIAERTICKQCHASLTSIAPVQPRAANRSKTVLRISLISGVIVLLLLACFAAFPSELDNLHRLAHMPPFSSSNTSTVRAALLNLVPIGTPDSDVIEFLQQAGAAVGPGAIPARSRQINCGPRVVGDGTFGPDIDCYIQGRRPSLMIFCEHLYAVSFSIDNNTKTLKGISVGETTQCL